MDCPGETRIYNPYEKKLDSQIVNGYFISYLEKYKEYRFYYLNYDMRIVEINNAKFIGMVKLVGVVTDNLCKSRKFYRRL